MSASGTLVSGSTERVAVSSCAWLEYSIVLVRSGRSYGFLETMTLRRRSDSAAGSDYSQGFLGTKLLFTLSSSCFV